MWYVIASLLGMCGGLLCMFLATDVKRRLVAARERELFAENNRLQESIQTLKRKEDDLGKAAVQLKQSQAKFSSQVIAYEELREENVILKRDLKNIAVNLNKIELDRDQQRRKQDELDERSNDLARRYLRENEKWLISSLTPNNFDSCKQRLLDVIERCRGIGFAVSPEEESEILSSLLEDYRRVVRAAAERENQARIRARIREEQKAERELEREHERIERERSAIRAALERALAEAKDEHSAEIEALRARLAEAEEKERKVSQAQLTKSGYVYVISNIGSFGDKVFKIGMTRRLEPLDRVKELGDASVPFPFDVHMMISSEDAPTLENALHRALHKLRINKMNPRKEFFKTEIEALYELVKEHHGEIEYVADAEALEYRHSLEMSDEEEEFIESVYDRLEDDGDSAPDDLEPRGSAS